MSCQRRKNHAISLIVLILYEYRIGVSARYRIVKGYRLYTARDKRRPFGTVWCQKVNSLRRLRGKR